MITLFKNLFGNLYSATHHAPAQQPAIARLKGEFEEICAKLRAEIGEEFGVIEADLRRLFHANAAAQPPTGDEVKAVTLLPAIPVDAPAPAPAPVVIGSSADVTLAESETAQPPKEEATPPPAEEKQESSPTE